MRIHHTAHRVKDLKIAIELMGLLGMEVTYKPDPDWALLKQGGNDTRIQLIESDIEPIPDRTDSHICFLSDDPAKSIEDIKRWAEDKKLKFIQGKWSDDEHWFDLPDIFTDFVVEIMATLD